MSLFVPEQWHANLAQMSAHIEAERRLPSPTDSNPAIKRLSSWIIEQKVHYDANQMPADGMRAAWEVVRARYGELLLKSEEKWRLMLAQLVSALDAGEYPPSATDNAKLRNWISNQKRNYKRREAIMAKPHIRAEWDAVAVKYSKHLYGDGQWHARFTQLIAYMDAEHRLPRENDQDFETKNLGAWACRQQSDYENKKNVMAVASIHCKWKAVREKYGEMFAAAHWDSMLASAIRYTETRSKAPSMYDADAATANLARWIVTQNYEYDKNLIISPEIRAKWGATIRTHSDLYAGIWQRVHDRFAAFVDAKKCLPGAADSDPVGRQLGAWFNLQHQNYRSRRFYMAHPGIRLEWLVTMGLFREYLPVDFRCVYGC